LVATVTSLSPLSSNDVFPRDTCPIWSSGAEEWPQHHPEAGSSWPSWPRASYLSTQEGSSVTDALSTSDLAWFLLEICQKWMSRVLWRGGLFSQNWKCILKFIWPANTGPINLIRPENYGFTKCHERACQNLSQDLSQNMRQGALEWIAVSS
jgi:hypothetical protein